MKRIRLAALCVVIAVMAGLLATATASATSYGAEAWGGDWDGQLGDGTTTLDSEVPRTLGTLSGVKTVAAGGSYGLALLESGHVWAWGYNDNGQLGDGNKKDSDVPVEVKGITDAVAIAAGNEYSLAVLSTGHVLAWGRGSDEPAEVAGLSGVTAVSTAGGHSLALLSSGKVETWGNNESGELGNGTTTYTTGIVEVSGLTKVTAIAAGGESGQDQWSLALLENGHVWAWGDNQFGELGDGTMTGPDTCSYTVIEEEIGEEEVKYACSDVPVEVSSITDATAIAAGGNSSSALLSTGHVVHWGDDVDVPTETKGLSSVTAIALGGNGGDGGGHGLALLSSGKVEAWGQNAYGDLGDGTTVNSEEPVTVSQLSGAAGIAASDSLSLSYGTPGPIVTSVTPDSGVTSGGTTVKIKGTGLASASAVDFDELAATIVSDSATEIEVTTPARKPGTVNVTVAATGTSGISAADEFTYFPDIEVGFGRCTNVGTGKGKYKDAACEEAQAGGKYEWTPGLTKTGFTSADATETVEKVVKPKQIEFETVAKAKLVCANESGTGAYLGTDELTSVALKFTGCEYGGAKCSSAGAAEGEIVTNTLEGVFGYTEKEANNVGVDLIPTNETESFMSASCGSASLAVRGSVIVGVSTVDKMASSLTLHFKEKKGKETFEHFEGEENDILEMSISGGAFEQLGLTADIVLSVEESLELNTVV